MGSRPHITTSISSAAVRSGGGAAGHKSQPPAAMMMPLANAAMKASLPTARPTCAIKRRKSGAHRCRRRATYPASARAPRG